MQKIKNMHNSSDSTWDESLFRHNYDAYVKLKDIEAYASEHIAIGNGAFWVFSMIVGIYG